MRNGLKIVSHILRSSPYRGMFTEDNMNEGKADKPGLFMIDRKALYISLLFMNDCLLGILTRQFTAAISCTSNIAKLRCTFRDSYLIGVPNKDE